jgi:hypothetical protein
MIINEKDEKIKDKIVKDNKYKKRIRNIHE